MPLFSKKPTIFEPSPDQLQAFFKQSGTREMGKNRAKELTQQAQQHYAQLEMTPPQIEEGVLKNLEQKQAEITPLEKKLDEIIDEAKKNNLITEQMSDQEREVKLNEFYNGQDGKENFRDLKQQITDKKKELSSMPGFDKIQSSIDAGAILVKAASKDIKDEEAKDQKQNVAALKGLINGSNKLEKEMADNLASTRSNPALREKVLNYYEAMFKEFFNNNDFMHASIIAAKWPPRGRQLDEKTNKIMTEAAGNWKLLQDHIESKLADKQPVLPVVPFMLKNMNASLEQKDPLIAFDALGKSINQGLKPQPLVKAHLANSPQLQSTEAAKASPTAQASDQAPKQPQTTVDNSAEQQPSMQAESQPVEKAEAVQAATPKTETVAEEKPKTAADKAKTQRSEITDEMYTTERKFIIDLEILSEEAKNLEVLVNKSKLSNDDKTLFKEMLKNSDELLAHRQKALEQYQSLRDNINSNPAACEQSFEQLKQISTDSVQHYGKHANLQDGSQRILARLQESFPKEMAAITKNIGEKSKARGGNVNDSMDSLLMKAVQRAPREVLLANELNKSLAPNPEKGLEAHPNHNQAQQFLDKTRENTATINTMKKDFEQANALKAYTKIKSKNPEIKASGNLYIKANNGPKDLADYGKALENTILKVDDANSNANKLSLKTPNGVGITIKKNDSGLLITADRKNASGKNITYADLEAVQGLLAHMKEYSNAQNAQTTLAGAQPPKFSAQTETRTSKQLPTTFNFLLAIDPIAAIQKPQENAPSPVASQPATETPPPMPPKPAQGFAEIKDQSTKPTPAPRADKMAGPSPTEPTAAMSVPSPQADAQAHATTPRAKTGSWMDMVSSLTGGLLDTAKNKNTKAEKKKENIQAIKTANDDSKKIADDIRTQQPDESSIKEWEQKLTNVQNKLAEIQGNNMLRKNNRFNGSTSVENQVSALEWQATSLHSFLKRQEDEMKKSPRELARDAKATADQAMKAGTEAKAPDNRGTKLK